MPRLGASPTAGDWDANDTAFDNMLEDDGTSGSASWDAPPTRGKTKRSPSQLSPAASARRGTTSGNSRDAYAAEDSWIDNTADAFEADAWSDTPPKPRRKTTSSPQSTSIVPAENSSPRRTSTRGTKSSASSSASRSSSSKKPPQKTERTPPRGLWFEVTGVLCLAVGVLLFYNAMRPAPDGFLPQLGVNVLRWVFGIGSYVVPLLLCVLGGVLVLRRHHTNLRAFWRGIAVGLPVLLTAVHLRVPVGHEFWSREILHANGGAIGGLFALLLRRSVGEIGAMIVLVAFSLVALLFLTEISLSEIVQRIGSWLHGGARGVRDKAQDAGDVLRRGFETEDDEYTEEYVEPRGRRTARPVASVVARALPPDAVPSNQSTLRRSPFLAVDDLIDPAEEEIEAFVPPAQTPFDRVAPAAPIVEPEPIVEPKIEAAKATKPEPEAPRIEIANTPPPASVVDVEPLIYDDYSNGQIIDDELMLMELEPLELEPVTVHTPLDAAAAKPEDEMSPTELLEAQAQASAGQGEAPKRLRPQKIRRHFGDGPLMPEYFDDAVRALDPPIMPDVAGVEEDIAQGVKAVQETMSAFKIDARVTDVKRGPVITRYEVQPAPGVRVASIANLDRDMARSLSALAVRIEAPVPGKNVVGIEVPNKRVHLVRLRDVLEMPEFLSAPSKLAFVLGKDIAGQAKWADLTKMPHMLVAGATNSGKSVCLNAIISSIITRASPEEVKFSLIDPKRVELTLYRDIPHLYHPVVVEPKDAVKVLRGMIVEMDRRYRKFAERGVRNIVSYNSKLEEGESPLPYIVIVIDELADLMMTAAAEFEKLICRLAQLARATGIHLIVATQRPSVNVITGVIKANIPARVAFAVASQVDSRTILDAVGAERLIGSGDMLFDANNGGKATRIQGAYLSEEEVNRIVEVVKEHYIYEPREYGLDLSAMDDDEADDEKPARGSDDKRDDLYDEIKEFVTRHQEMSASLIQRKFEIGYPRAGRIVDQLERDGVLGPADGPKPRKVLGRS
jgi:S-DNA-T family DNA segregation ATPase FtsK/SpoIIIE